MPPSLPTRVVADAAAGVFGALARAREARALHPKGVVLTARARLRPVPGVPALSSAREVDALVRSSKALGTPDGVADIMGIAVRLLDLHGPGGDQDLLLASCPPPPGHVMLTPVRDPGRAWYTSLLPYRVGDRRRVIVARGLGGGRFALSLAGVGRGLEPFGTVEAGEPLGDADAQLTRFDVFANCVPELRQSAGFLDEVRRRAYAGSRAGAPRAAG